MDEVSRILKDIEKKVRNTDDNEKAFHLLYKSGDKVDVEEFHKSCDGKGPTLTVLYGIYNTVFGGYTSQDWCSGDKMTKLDKNAFLFYKNDHPKAKCNFFPIKEGYEYRAITCDANFGPTFGGGVLVWDDYDLLTFKKDSRPESESKDDYIKLNGTLNFGYAYETRALKRKEVNAGELLIKRIEIYQVVDGILPEPWRRKPTNEEMEEMKRKLEETEPLPNLGIETYNVLLVGTIGSGKSSTYNTWATVCTGAVRSHAQARDVPTSVTNEVHAYALKSKSGKPLHIRIFDIRGFEDNRGYEHEFDLLLDGKLPIGYKFPDQPEPVPQDKLQTASLKDEIHLVCFVTRTSNLDTMTPALHERIKTIQKSIDRKGLPMVVVATRFDDLCQKISEDADRVYKSWLAREATKTLSNFYRIEEKKIFPIINYVNDADINDGKDRLALQALYDMVKLSRAYLEKQSSGFLLQEPWRKKPTDEEMTEMKLRLEKMEPLPGLGIKTYNILLVGVIGAGKSTFYNTLATVFTGAVKSHAPARDALTSVTNEVHAYELKSKNGKPLHIRIFDIRGFEDNRGYEHEIDLLLDGKLPIGYKFPVKPEPIPEDRLISASLKNEIHLVCFITGSSNLDTLTPELLERIKSIKASINNKGLPMTAVATKVDDLCQHISRDADLVYRSPIAHNALKRVSSFFGLQEKFIFPIVNYVNDSTMQDGKDRLALQALNAMVELSRDYLENHREMPSKLNCWSKLASKLHLSRHCSEKEIILKEISTELEDLGDEVLRMLCVGPVGSGKSSFIDSLSSALRDEICGKASGYAVCGKSKGEHLVSTTQRFNMYKMKYKNESGKIANSNVYIGDIPGFQDFEGIQLEAVKQVIHGHVPNKYKTEENVSGKKYKSRSSLGSAVYQCLEQIPKEDYFSSFRNWVKRLQKCVSVKGEYLKIIRGISRDSDKYIHEPQLKDKVHCVCLVIDVSNSADNFSEKMQNTLKTLLAWLHDKGIQYIVILTKGNSIDKMKDECKLRVFENEILEENKIKLMEMFQFKESKMFPVINYVHEDTVVPEIDALLITAFHEVLKLGKEYLTDFDGDACDDSDDEENVSNA